MAQLWGACLDYSSEGLGMVGLLPGPHSERQGTEPSGSELSWSAQGPGLHSQHSADVCCPVFQKGSILAALSLFLLVVVGACAAQDAHECGYTSVRMKPRGVSSFTGHCRNLPKAWLISKQARKSLLGLQ